MTVVVRLALDGTLLGRNALREDMILAVLKEEAASDPEHLVVDDGQEADMNIRPEEEEEGGDKTKKKKKKGKFKNCVAVHMGKRCMKVFTNGRLQITGVHSPLEVDEAVQVAIDVVARCLSVSSRTITACSTTIELISMNMYVPDVRIDEVKMQNLFQSSAKDIGLHRVYIPPKKKFLCAIFSDHAVANERSKKPNCRIHRTGNIMFSSKSTETMATMFNAVLVVLQQMNLTMVAVTTSKKRKQQIPLIEVAIAAGMAHNHLPCRERRPDCPYCRLCGNVMMMLR